MKRPSSSDFKRTSRLVQNATVDNTKIPRARSRPSMLPGDRVFRNERRARVAQRGTPQELAAVTGPFREFIEASTASSRWHIRQG